jgi:hypothetical protein
MAVQGRDVLLAYRRPGRDESLRSPRLAQRNPEQITPDATTTIGVCAKGAIDLWHLISRMLLTEFGVADAAAKREAR